MPVQPVGTPTVGPHPGEPLLGDRQVPEELFLRGSKRGAIGLPTGQKREKLPAHPREGDRSVVSAVEAPAAVTAVEPGGLRRQDEPSSEPRHCPALAVVQEGRAVGEKRPVYERP